MMTTYEQLTRFFFKKKDDSFRMDTHDTINLRHVLMPLFSSSLLCFFSVVSTTLFNVFFLGALCIPTDALQSTVPHGIARAWGLHHHELK
jgi:hypothetical protein